MEKIKARWEIEKDWQLLFPILGFLSLVFTAYLISSRIIGRLNLEGDLPNWGLIIISTVMLYWIMLRFFLWCFKKLENKWIVDQKWEMIAIFLVFAITGSLSARLAAPLMDFLGLTRETMATWAYWMLRIVIILPIYQVILIVVGWLFGQFEFFKAFEIKMLKRFGLGFLFK